MPTQPQRVYTDDPNDMSEMLQELRILLQGSQVLTAFLIILPFSAGFRAIIAAEKWVFVVTFLSSLVSLILFSAPAVHHRLLRPLQNRIAFKDFASRMMVLGLVPLSLALALATQLIASEVVGEGPAIVLAVCVAVLLVGVWWVLPIVRRRRLERLEGSAEPAATASAEPRADRSGPGDARVRPALLQGDVERLGPAEGSRPAAHEEGAVAPAPDGGRQELVEGRGP